MSKKKPAPQKKAEVIESVLCGALLVVLIYIAANGIAILGGISEGGEPERYHDCYEAPSHLSSLFPGYKFGCYLAAPIKMQCYDYDTCTKRDEERDRKKAEEFKDGTLERYKRWLDETVKERNECYDKLEKRGK